MVARRANDGKLRVTGGDGGLEAGVTVAKAARRQNGNEKSIVRANDSSLVLGVCP